MKKLAIGLEFIIAIVIVVAAIESFDIYEKGKKLDELTNAVVGKTIINEEHDVKIKFYEDYTFQVISDDKVLPLYGFDHWYIRPWECTDFDMEIDFQLDSWPGLYNDLYPIYDENDNLIGLAGSLWNGKRYEDVIWEFLD